MPTIPEKQILDTINKRCRDGCDTDIFITADHGFATISKRDIDTEARNDKLCGQVGL